MGAAVAAAAVIRKEKELVAIFRERRALSPASAMTLADLGVHPRLAWTILERHSVIREAQPGLYYLDEAAWAASIRARRRRAAVLAPAIILIVLAIAFLTERLSRR